MQDLQRTQKSDGSYALEKNFLSTSQEGRQVSDVSQVERPWSNQNSSPKRCVIRTEVLTDFAQLEGLADEWDQLWNGNPRREIFTKFPWVRAWWRAYGRQRSLCTPAVFNGDRLVGVLPVVAEGRTLRFLGTPGADYNDLLCEPTAGAEILESLLWALCDLPTPWDRCVLDNIPDTSRIITDFRQLSGRLRSRLCLVSGSSCPSLVLRDRRSELLGAIRSKKDLRQHQNNLRKRGELVFRHLEDPEEIKLHLPTFFQQDIARWAVVGSKSPFSREEIRTFFHALVDELDPRSDLRFSVLELDRRPIAYHLGFESHGKFIFYKPTFDVNLWKKAPGGVLIRCLFEYVSEREVREFDFTRGNEAYKHRFANHVRRNYTLYLYPSGPRGRAVRLCKRVEERAKAQLKRNPRLFLAIKATVAGVSRICRRYRLALQRNGLLELSKKLVAKTFRTTLFARDEVLVFSYNRETQALEDDHLKIWRGTLAELANLSVKYPGFLDVSRLQTARERLNRDDLVYVAQDGDDFVHLAWMGTAKEVTATEVGFKCRIELDHPISIIYDCWTNPANRAQEISPRVLRQLAERSPKEHRQVWTYCRSDDFATQRGIERAGFQLRYRMGRIRVLHWFSRQWVRQVGPKLSRPYGVLGLPW
jgi:CelD/BcsL family acetyltransferase involved in cellulose biosynthesis